MIELASADYRGIMAEAVLVVFASLLFLGRPTRRAAGLQSFLGIAMALLATAPQWLVESRELLFGGAYVCSPLAAFLKALILVAGAVAVAMIHADREVKEHHAEILALVLLVMTGGLLLVSARHLALAYVAFEMLSVPSYALVGSIRGGSRSSEGGLKYAVFGGAASGAMLYGLSLIYGLAGSLYFPAIAQSMVISTPGVVACILVFAGVMYKMAASPFHYWCPDAFEAAPTSVAGFLSIAPKVAGMGFLLSLSAVFDFSPTWTALLAAAAALSMTYGNLAAMAQTNVKRLLAYSSIAHAGYLLVAASLDSMAGDFAILLYLAVYLFMNLGAFHVVALAAPGAGIDEFKGLGKRSGFLAFSMAVFLFSLTGLPPFGGFTGKLFIVSAALQKGAYVLAALLVVNSVVSLYYYARILRAMYFERPAAETEIELTRLDEFAISVAAAMVLATGVMWKPLARAVGRAVGL